MSRYFILLIITLNFLSWVYSYYVLFILFFSLSLLILFLLLCAVVFYEYLCCFVLSVLPFRYGASNPHLCPRSVLTCLLLDLLVPCSLCPSFVPFLLIHSLKSVLPSCHSPSLVPSVSLFPLSFLFFLPLPFALHLFNKSRLGGHAPRASTTCSWQCPPGDDHEGTPAVELLPPLSPPAKPGREEKGREGARGDGMTRDTGRRRGGAPLMGTKWMKGKQLGCRGWLRITLRPMKWPIKPDAAVTLPAKAPVWCGGAELSPSSREWVVWRRWFSIPGRTRGGGGKWLWKAVTQPPSDYCVEVTWDDRMQVLRGEKLVEVFWERMRGKENIESYWYPTYKQHLMRTGYIF